MIMPAPPRLRQFRLQADRALDQAREGAGPDEAPIDEVVRKIGQSLEAGWSKGCEHIVSFVGAPTAKHRSLAGHEIRGVQRVDVDRAAINLQFARRNPKRALETRAPIRMLN